MLATGSATTDTLIAVVTVQAGIIVTLLGWVGSRLWIRVDRLASAIEQLSTLYAVHVAEHEALERRTEIWSEERRAQERRSRGS